MLVSKIVGGRSRSRGRWTAVLLALVALALTPSASYAGEVAPPFPTPTAGAEPLRALVVLDVSGSMRRDGGHGQSLLDGARRAMSELLYSLPRETQVGFRTFGSEVPSGERGNCTDSRLVTPIQPLRPDRILSAAAALQPTGDTPIGHALTQAAKDFPNGSTARDAIVLITDGEDTCGELPPCEVVRTLKQGGLEVHIETVGVNLARGSTARDQLQCISAVTGGRYYDAQNSDALSAALHQLGRQALGRLGGGTAIKAAARRQQATVIEPGEYRVQIRPGQVSWFRFTAPENARPRVLATVQGAGTANPMPKEYRDCPSWRVELRNSAGEGYVYPPYGNSAIFDGVGFGSSGASTTEAVRRNSTGIDYSGRWTLALLLGRDFQGEPLDCAEHLPDRAYDVRFTLDYDGLADLDAAAGPSASATPAPSETSGPSGPSEEPRDVSAAEKYRNPYDPEEAPGAFSVLGPVLFFAVALGFAALLYRVIQRRRRGW